METTITNYVLYYNDGVGIMEKNMATTMGLWGLGCGGLGATQLRILGSFFACSSYLLSPLRKLTQVCGIRYIISLLSEMWCRCMSSDFLEAALSVAASSAA